MIFRTEFGRLLTSRAIANIEGQGADGSRRVLSAALHVLSHPFEHTVWELNSTGFSSGACDSDADEAECSLHEWLREGLAALSPRETASRQSVQTSCGGQ